MNYNTAPLPSTNYGFEGSPGLAPGMPGIPQSGGVSGLAEGPFGASTGPFEATPQYGFESPVAITPQAEPSRGSRFRGAFTRSHNDGAPAQAPASADLSQWGPRDELPSPWAMPNSYTPAAANALAQTPAPTPSYDRSAIFGHDSGPPQMLGNYAPSTPATNESGSFDFPSTESQATTYGGGMKAVLNRASEGVQPIGAHASEAFKHLPPEAQQLVRGIGSGALEGVKDQFTKTNRNGETRLKKTAVIRAAANPLGAIGKAAFTTVNGARQGGTEAYRDIQAQNPTIAQAQAIASGADKIRRRFGR